jgi:hypothetical protein
VTLQEYFALPDTPATESPVGKTIVKVLAKFPELTFEQARVKANELVTDAGHYRNFALPQVQTPAEEAAATEKARAYFKARERATAIA